MGDFHEVKCFYRPGRRGNKYSAPYHLECLTCDWGETAFTKQIARERRDFHLRLNRIHEDGQHLCHVETTHVFKHGRQVCRQLVCQVCGPIRQIQSRREGRVEGHRHFWDARRLHAAYA